MMKPQYALRLDNVLCRAGYVECRKGWSPHKTGFAATVETILNYTSVSGSSQRFAAAGTNVYDATAAGAIGAAVVSGLTSAYLAYTQVSNQAGNYLFFCNASDTEKVYDGATWANSGFTGPVAGTLSHVAVWKRRVWWVERNSTKAWYGAVDAISGAMTAFNFSGIFRKGGRLLSILNWTVDGGDGADDYLLAVSSMGEVAVYKGTDPSAAATFALVGVYYVGAPVGERYYAALGGDVLLLTSEGLIAFSKFLQSATIDRRSNLTDTIQQLISSEISTYGSVRGWEIHVFYDDNFLLVQVPAGSVGSRYQYVMSLITGAWSRFIVAPAVTWSVQGANLWMGQQTRVANGWTTGLDNGQPIVGVIIPAFSYFGGAANRKQFTLGRLTIESDTPPTVSKVLLKEFDQTYSFPSGTAAVPSGAVWDSAVWDVATWGGSTSFYRDWYVLGGVAYAATQAIQFISAGDVFRLIALDYVYQTGGIL